MITSTLKAVKTNLQKNIFLRNWFALTASSFAIQGLSVVSSIRIARVLEPSGYGLYNIVFVHIGFLGILAAFGMRSTIVRFISRNPGSSCNVFYYILLIRILTISVALLALYFYYTIFDSSNIAFWPLAVLLIIFNSLYDSVEIVVMGLEKMSLPAVSNFVFTLLWVVTILLMPNKYFTVQYLITIYILVQVLKTIVAYSAIKYMSTFEYNAAFTDIFGFSKQILKESMPYFWIALLTAGTNQLPVLFLYSKSGASEVAFYTLAYKILNPLQLILSNALNALFPRVSYLAVNDKPKFHSIIKKSYKFLLLVSICSALPITLFREEIVLILYGKAYIESAAIIPIQVWFFILFSFVWLTGIYFGALDKQNLLSNITMIRTAVQVPILWYGAGFGAYVFSVTYVICAAFDVLLHWFFFRKILKKELPLKFLIGIFCTLILGIIFSILFPNGVSLALKLVILIVGTGTGYIVYKKKFAQNSFNHNLL